MLDHHKVVVQLSAKKLIVGRVVLGKKTLVKDRFESQWTPKTLPEIFQEIKSEYKTSRIRVVLNDKLSHLLELKIPSETKDLRQYVSEQIEKKIPEILENDEWDFKKSVFPLSKEDKVIVFAPKKNVLAALVNAAEKSQLTIEAIEPEKVSLRRSENPAVGIALKKDIEGPDEKVLNISVEEEDNSSRFSFVAGIFEKKYLIIAGVLFILIGGALAFYTYFGGIGGSEKISVEVEKSEPETEEASPSAELVEEVKLEEYAVQVLNGSGVAGEAGRIKDLLTEKGFVEIDTGNAASFDFVNITIQKKLGVPDKVTETIKETVKGTYVDGETLIDDSSYDVIITLGLESSETPAPETP